MAIQQAGSVNSSSVELASGRLLQGLPKTSGPLHRFNCPSLRLGYGRLGTCEPHPSPPGQVNSCHMAPVHYISTVTIPELAFSLLSDWSLSPHLGQIILDPAPLPAIPCLGYRFRKRWCKRKKAPHENQTFVELVRRKR